MKNMPVAALLTGITIFPAGLVAQGEGDRIEAEFASVAESIVRIRTTADLEAGHSDRRSQSFAPEAAPYSVDGTGVVVGTTHVDGRLEYLILTNHHVADASNYVLDSGAYLRVNPTNTLATPLVEEKSYLMTASTENITVEDTELVELVRHVRGDMTLMRTVGAVEELTVFGGMIGYIPGELKTGDLVITSGYPLGGEKLVAQGQIAEVDRFHQLGLSHRDLIVDVPVSRGQSGGPIFLIEGDPEAGEAIEFRLIGLVHAKDASRNYAVPYALWEDVLDEFPAELQDRLVRH